MGAAQHSEGGVCLSDVETLPGVAMMVSEVVPGDAMMISNVVSGVAVDVPWSRYHREGSPGPEIWVRPRVLYNGEGLVVIT